MEIYAPSYYKNFKCTADKCEHSCCIGWEIDIDEISLEKYQNLDSEYGAIIKKSISFDDTPHFKLEKNQKCPHLDECGLCKIIINQGEDYLCDICKEHPRFYNFTDSAELGIGICCREACEIVLFSPDYSTFEYVGEVDATERFFNFDSKGERKKIYEALSNPSVPYEKRLKEIYESYSIKTKNDEYWLSILDSLEYLDEEHKNLFMKYSAENRPKGFDEHLERFLAYFIYRHVTEAEDMDDFCRRLSFCLFSERLFAALIFNENPSTKKELVALASIISEEIEYSYENTLALGY